MNEELRQILEGHENRMERLVHRMLAPLIDRLDRIEKKVDKTNGRVTHLEAHRIATDATNLARTEAVKQAAELVAEKAQEAISARERSRSWWIKLVGAITGAIIAVTTLTSLLAQYLHTGP